MRSSRLINDTLERRNISLRLWVLLLWCKWFDCQSLTHVWILNWTKEWHQVEKQSFQRMHDHDLSTTDPHQSTHINIVHIQTGNYQRCGIIKEEKKTANHVNEWVCEVCVEPIHAHTESNQLMIHKYKVYFLNLWIWITSWFYSFSFGYWLLLALG